MELSFVLSALRRRLWLVALFALLGSLPGLLRDEPTSTSYESVAKINIVQPTRGGINFLQIDPNRYVIGQLSVLESASLVNQVALDNDMSITDVREGVKVEQDPETDVVDIVATFGSPDEARLVAQSFVDGYMATLDTDVGDSEEVQRLDREIARLRNQLTNLNDAIQEKAEPFIAIFQTRRTAYPPLPPGDLLDPARISERNVVESELTQLIQQRNTLISESRLRVNTEVIQDATLPPEPVPAGGQFLLAGGLFAGAMLGIVAALAWARFSNKVLDIEMASEILGAPVVSELPHYRSLVRQPLAAFQALPRSAVPVIDQLCVRAEAKARIDQPLTVAVVGTQRGSGTTTLALAMAERFASGGSSVVLIDGDVRDPRITAIFNAAQDGGVPAVVMNDGALIDQRGRSVFTRTMDPEVSVLGLGPSRGAASLRRDTVSPVLEAGRRKAQIVVVDCGPALDLASTLQISAMADAVVLAVPLSRQKSDGLADLSRQLDNVRAKLLPVISNPSRRPARGQIFAADGAIRGGGSGPGGGSRRSREPLNAAAPGPEVRSASDGEAMVLGAGPARRSDAPPSGPV